MENVEFKGALAIINKINATPVTNEKKKKSKNEYYKAYVVGGYCRDYLLGIPSHDVDIATSCPPDVLRKIFGDSCEIVNEATKSCKVTIDFPFERESFKTSSPNDKKSIESRCNQIRNKYKATSYTYERVSSKPDEKGEWEILVSLTRTIIYEVTSFRKDGASSDHRHPDSTIVVDSMKIDCERRDFTVNAMYMDYLMNLYDYVGGEEDVKNKIIRTVGKPSQRFQEDKLRMLRAFRFAVKCGFTIEEETYKAIKEKAPLIDELASSRIKEELKGMVGVDDDKSADIEYWNKNEQSFRRMLPQIIESGICSFSPELQRALEYLDENYVEGTRINHIYILMSYLAKQIPTRFEFTKAEQKEIDIAIKYVKMLENRDLSIENLIGYSDKAMTRALHVAKILRINTYTKQDVLDCFELVKIGSKKEMFVNGRDIMENFNVEGPEIDDLLEEAYDAILYDDLPNNKTEILEYLRGLHIDKKKDYTETEEEEDKETEKDLVEKEYSDYLDEYGDDEDEE